MANRTKFAGRYRALDYFYGGPNINNSPNSLLVQTAPAAVGSASVTLQSGQIVLTDGTVAYPLNINAPVLVGSGSNQETVTPSAVTGVTSTVPGTAGFTATFANLHGVGDPIASATAGLQEAINDADNNGGGVVVIDAFWTAAGGTDTILAAVIFPTSGRVRIEDTRSGTAAQAWGLNPSSLTVVAAPATATSAVVASQAAITGTWAASTTHVQFTYVTADGGESLPSADYSFTATLNVAIGGSGPIASTGAVGYRVYIGTTAWLAPVTAANGTVIQCGPIAAFKIGTAFSIAALTVTGLALVPTKSTAFPAAAGPIAAPNMAQPFATVYPPFAVTSTVTAGTALEWGHVQLPTGFLNRFGRCIRLKIMGYYTPVSTATLILSVNIVSVSGVTSTTVFTVTTPASSGTSAANINAEVYIVTASTGAAGTVECHGTLIYGGATGTAGLMVSAGDSVQVVSSAADLTLQDLIQITINSGTANLTTSQLRCLIVEVLA